MITYKRNINLKLLLKSKGTNDIEQFLPQGKKCLYSAAVRLGLLDVIDSLNFGNDDFVLLPPLCPQGIILPFQRKNVKCEFYHLTDNFKTDILSLTNRLSDKNCRAVFVIHFFGFFNSQIYEIRDLCTQKNVILIEDVVQGLFSKDQHGNIMGNVGDISIFSLPKFLPVPDGAVFVINRPELNIKFSYKRNFLIPFSIFFHLNSLLINSLISSVSNSIIYKTVKNISLLNYTAYYFFLFLSSANQDISKISKRILSNIDYNQFINQRVELVNLCNKHLYNYQLDQITPNLSGYPLTVKSGENEVFKVKLKNTGIEPLSYVKGWNYIPQTTGYEKEFELLHNHLLLPIDSKVPIAEYEEKLLQIKEYLKL